MYIYYTHYYTLVYLQSLYTNVNSIVIVYRKNGVRRSRGGGLLDFPALEVLYINGGASWRLLYIDVAAR